MATLVDDAMVTAASTSRHRRFGWFCAADRTRQSRPFGRSGRAAAFPTLSIVVLSALRSVLAEPRAPGAPVRVWRDWAVAAAIVVGSTIEMLTRNDVSWPIPTLIASFLVAATVFPRRQHPLAMTIIALAIVNGLSLAIWMDNGQAAGYYSMAFLLVVPYSLFRWGSGRDAGIGVGILLLAWLIGITTDPGTIGDAIGGLMVLAFTAALGVAIRTLGALVQREFEEIKLLEREQLARELHDTVAHHVSAIAVQAQAGQAVAAQRPEVAVETLAVIEETAKRTLAEMRAMVGALRNSDDPALVPQGGISDLQRLAAAAAGPLTIDVELSGDLDNVGPLVDAAVYRIAQESITNAVRHARNASRVSVNVVGHDDRVELMIADDGDTAPFDAEPANGYGLLGMAERAKLLGGTLNSGPCDGGGWATTATLPRTGVVS
jgi:two-component sensor histidine kinase